MINFKFYSFYVALEDALSAVADEVYKDLEDDYEEILGEYRDFERNFQDRLYEKWKGPLDKVELLIHLSQELGSGLLRKYQNKGEFSHINVKGYLALGQKV
ncbi:hypothetical protein AKJ37_06640 [candidate division MSBL1 archaeon SCGC-AAA259I09]|uniref:Uncharacterized protein n=1 Tax=candidate division MSBL1 archaeon SCGC-AAA259I09 TaxID=1698267 RepID=A0A133UNJ9_9EURY|nr:hypothetical protein AKJ37_06640 [candidate division MSBL1 archaeon SCGC-AAA259I09]